MDRIQKTDRTEKIRMTTFSFADFTRVLLKNKWTIISMTIGVMFITGVISFLLPKRYKATVTLIISESKMGSDSVISNYFNPRFYYTFEGMVKNKRLVQQGLKEYSLDKAPYNLKVDDLIDSVKVALKRNTRLINLSVEFNDSEIASKLANFIAEEAVKLNMKLNEEESKRETEFMKKQVSEVAHSMRKNEQILKDYKQKAAIKEIETDVETLLYSKADLKLRRLDAEVKKAEMSAVPKTVKIEKTEPEKSIKEIDALIISLDKMIIDIEKDLDGKQKLLAERELRLEALMTLFDADQVSYRNINTRSGQNAIKVSEKFQQIRIVDPALPPFYAEWPRKKLLVIIAGGLAFLIICAYSILREQLKYSE
jgi:uncharacterized protein involved in exopolysaccharide biosynthesis